MGKYINKKLEWKIRNGSLIIRAVKPTTIISSRKLKLSRKD